MISSNMIMTGSYDYRLVALSVLIATSASYTALDVAARVTSARGWVRSAWLAGGGAAMGFGIWSMHFIGMQAFSLPVAVSYDWPLALLSLFAAIFASTAALYIASQPKLTAFRALSGSIVMGGGIAGMHYIAMAAMRLPATCCFNPFLVTLSVPLAVLFSLAALRRGFHFREGALENIWDKVISAILLGAAVSAIHYTGMTSASFSPSGVLPNLSGAVSISSLGTLGIGTVTLIVLGFALLSSYAHGRFAAQTQELQPSVHFRQIADTLQEVLALINADFTEILYVNRAYEKIWGRTRESLYADPMSWLGGVHAEDRKHVTDALHRLLGGEQIDDLEYRVVRPNGSTSWVASRGYPVRDSNGDLHRLVCSAQDITERRRAEAALRESEDRYRDLVENSQDLICTHSPEGILLSINEAPLRILGYTREEMLNKPLRDFVAPETRPLCDAYLAQVQIHGSAKGLLPVLTKSGEVRVWEYNNSVRQDGVNPPIVRGIAHDVTEQKFVERALRRSEEKFSKIFQSSPIAICITTLATGRFVDVNEGFQQQSQFHREELIGHTSLELGLWADPAQRKAIVDETCAGKAIRSRELQFRNKGGEIRTKLYSAEPIQIGLERCLLAVSEDITQRKQDEEKLREYEKVIEGMDDMIAVVDRDYRYLLANRAFVSYRGMEKEQVVGRLVSDVLDRTFFASTIKEKLDECFQGRIVKYETLYTYPKIGVRDLFVSYFPIDGPVGVDRVVCILQDITEQRRAEESVQRLSGRLLRLQDEERRKIARDLHDTTGQDLVAMSATLSQLTASIVSSNRKPRKLVSQCQALVDRCIREVRTLSYVLYPPMLEEAGLEDAIRHYLEGFAERTGIEVGIDVSPRFARLSREMELGLFRVVQESLINIQRHSGSFTARIGLDRNEGRIVLTVSDQGRGILASKRKGNGAVPVANGVGIPSMYERVKQIGGRLDIESGEHGTTVRVIIPMHE